jgi:hypothetical protein
MCTENLLNITHLPSIWGSLEIWEIITERKNWDIEKQFLNTVKVFKYQATC